MSDKVDASLLAERLRIGSLETGVYKGRALLVDPGPRSGHFNPDGNRLVAVMLLQHFQRARPRGARCS